MPRRGIEYAIYLCSAGTTDAIEDAVAFLAEVVQRLIRGEAEARPIDDVSIGWLLQLARQTDIGHGAELIDEATALGCSEDTALGGSHRRRCHPKGDRHCECAGRPAEVCCHDSRNSSNLWIHISSHLLVNTIFRPSGAFLCCKGCSLITLPAK